MFHYFSSQSRKSNTKILILFFFVLLSFFFSITHNSKGIQCIRTICTPNDYTTIRDLPFLCQSCMWARINKLWPQKRVMVAFLYAVLCVITCTLYMHNSKTKGRVRMVYLSNDCSTIGDMYSFGQSCMWDTISELWILTPIAITFRYGILCVHTLVTRKLQVVCRCST